MQKTSPTSSLFTATTKPLSFVWHRFFIVENARLKVAGGTERLEIDWQN